MYNKKLVNELLKLAKEIMAADTFPCPTCGTKVLENTGYCLKCKKKVKKAAEDKTAYRLPQKRSTVEKMIKDAGLGYDADQNGFFFYKPTAIGLYNYQDKTNCFKGDNAFESLEAVIRKPLKICGSIEKNVKFHEKMLNALAKCKKPKSKVNLARFISKRARLASRKAINALLEDAIEAMEEGDSISLGRIVKKLYNAVEKIIDGYNNQLKAYSNTRRLAFTLRKLIKKNPDILREIFGMVEEEKAEEAIDEDANLKIIKNVMQKHESIKFFYRKKSGEERVVNVTPDKLKNTSKGWMVLGHDLDRNADRCYYVSSILKFL